MKKWYNFVVVLAVLVVFLVPASVQAVGSLAQYEPSTGYVELYNRPGGALRGLNFGSGLYNPDLCRREWCQDKDRGMWFQFNGGPGGAKRALPSFSAARLLVTPVGLNSGLGLDNCGVVYKPSGEFSALYCSTLTVNEAGTILFGELAGDYVLIGYDLGEFKPVSAFGH